MEKYTNALANESSLYLLQHAHNPVNWVAWSHEVFELAQKEQKLVLVSVGYSACHWCHVMEHECFEDEEVAALMNKYFICIKVDREERPDVDQVYMNAVQLMTQRGGWPLNCFTLPDGRPIYGGTYFPKEQWMHVLKSLQHTFTNDLEKVVEYAEKLTEGVQKSELISRPEPVVDLPEDKLPELVRRWSAQFDIREGGPARAPKFPLPNNYLFLLHYAQWKQDENLKKHVKLTLQKMCRGGIYDQIGGGFSRYSVDMRWKVPHFEKMLYDNGQLLSLYAEAYRFDPDPEYKWVLESMLHWLEREMTGPENGLFAAQDADSEGEEGKYYVWSLDELKSILGKDATAYLDLYNPENKGFWEHNQWILLRDQSVEEFCRTHPDATADKIEQCNQLLFAERKRRIAPVTDTKCLTSWNALTISGLLDAYVALKDDAFLLMALKTGNWICSYQLRENNHLWHTRQNGKSFINGFLDDYAFTIEAFLKLYQITAYTNWLEKAASLMKIALEHFFDSTSGMFYFTPSSHDLIARKMELNDNVIPATNSAMAQNLLTLGMILENDDFIYKSRQMLQNMLDGMEHYGSGYSNWALLLQRLLRPRYNIHVHGEPTDRAEIINLLSPQVTLRYEKSEQTGYIICGEGSCSALMTNLAEVRLLIQ